jgi:hypothetical protein
MNDVTKAVEIVEALKDEAGDDEQAVANLDHVLGVLTGEDRWAPTEAAPVEEQPNPS